MPVRGSGSGSPRRGPRRPGGAARRRADAGTPPNCQAPSPCPTGEHKHDTCHADHGDAPCGTGPWRPHTGHGFVTRTPCKPEPCGGSGGQGATVFHKHGRHGCHADTPRHVHEPQNCERGAVGHTHPIDGGSEDTGCHTHGPHNRKAGQGHCPYGHTETGGHGSRNCTKNADYNEACPGGYKWDADRELCYLDGAVKITQDVGKVIAEIEGFALCTWAAGGLAGKVVDFFVKRGSEIARDALKLAVGDLVFEPPCYQAWKKLTEWAENNFYDPDTAEPNNGGEADDKDGQPTPTTQAPTPTTPPTTTEAPTKITWDDVWKKRAEWLEGKATQRDVNDLVDRLLCQNGVTERCK